MSDLTEKQKKRTLSNDCVCYIQAKNPDIVEYYETRTHELRWLIKKDGSRVLQEKIVKRYGYNKIEAEWIDIPEEIEKLTLEHD